jgi:DNA-binding NarL/FixJ family response regulator
MTRLGLLICESTRDANRVIPSKHDPPGISGNGQVGHTVRVLVADNHPAYRTSIVRALGLVPEVEVAGEVETVDQACQLVLTLSPDVVLIDLSTPGIDGLGATRRIRRSSPVTRVIVLTAYDEPSIEQAALAAGASSVVTKGSPLEDVVGVILDAAHQTV